MTFTKKYPASELPTSLDETGNDFQRIIATYEKKAEKNKVPLPPTLLLEIESFVKQNRIRPPTAQPVVLEEDICFDCLKAHVLTFASRQGFGQQDIKKMNKAFPGVVGHQGYYLNEGEVRKSFSVL